MTYLGKGGQIPYLNKETIVRNVEEVLEECWGDEFPVDIEVICDDLGIAIIPVTGLSKLLFIDAYISSDFKTIYVDEKEFEKESPRYRFSVAHELGHFVLHKKYYPRNVKNSKEWLAISHSIMNDYAEFQANYFAGSLLVPEMELVRVLNDAFGGSFSKNYWNASINEKWKILGKIRKHFNVSDEVIARRIIDAFPGVGEK